MFLRFIQSIFYICAVLTKNATKRINIEVCYQSTLNLLKMNKNDFIHAVAEEAGLSKADAKRAVDGYHKVITHALKKGDKVTLIGFGTFSVSRRAARTGRNPQTGKEIKIKAKNVAKFKAGSALSGAVN